MHCRISACCDTPPGHLGATQRLCRTIQSALETHTAMSPTLLFKLQHNSHIDTYTCAASSSAATRTKGHMSNGGMWDCKCADPTPTHGDYHACIHPRYIVDLGCTTTREPAARHSPPLCLKFDMRSIRVQMQSSSNRPIHNIRSGRHHGVAQGCTATPTPGRCNIRVCGTVITCICWKQ